MRFTGIALDWTIAAQIARMSAHLSNVFSDATQSVMTDFEARHLPLGRVTWPLASIPRERQKYEGNYLCHMSSGALSLGVRWGR